MIFRFADSQKARPLSITPFLIFPVFTGLIRALEESFFFGSQLSADAVLGYFAFYFALSLCLLAGFANISSFRNLRLGNGILPGIFLGTFPPLIDLALSGPDAQIRYSYYQLQSFAHIPWFFHYPAIGIPPGETITVWLAIAFSGVYAYRIAGSAWKAVLCSLWTYLVIFVFVIAAPILTAYHNGLSMTAPGPIAAYQARIAARATYDLVSVQLLLAATAVLMINRRLLVEILKKILHTVPFVLLALCGTFLVSTPSFWAWTSACLIGFTFMHALLINNFLDKDDDATGGRSTQATKFVSDASLTTMLIFSVWFAHTGHLDGFCYALIICLTLAYSAKTMQAKRHFFSAMKIESAWALCSILAGILPFPAITHRPSVFLTAVVTAAGVGLASLWRDYKDLEADRKSATRTLYVILYDRLADLPKTRLIINWMILPPLSVPLICFLILDNNVGALTLLVAGYLILVATVHSETALRRFQPVLAALGLYLAGIAWSLYHLRSNNITLFS